MILNRLGDNISFMDALKLVYAWLSIVPSPKKSEPQQYFLDVDATKIMNKLSQRYEDLSADLNTVKTGCNGNVYVHI